MVSGKDFSGDRIAWAGARAITVAVIIGLAWCQPGVAAQAPGDTLILVNGDAITVSDFDQLVMQAHRSVKMEEESGDLGIRLLEKRIKDILLIQDALAAGMDEDPAFVADLRQKEMNFAIQQYVKDNLTLPEEASEDSVRAFFARYYWQIQFRQLSVRTRTEAEAAKAAVMAGADMDTLARSVSLDTKKLNGGLHNLTYWADVPNVFRDQLRDLSEGALSDVFPLNDAFAFLRMERRLPLDEETYPEIKRTIAPIVLGQQRQEAWDRFVAEKTREVPLQEDAGIVMSVLADSLHILEPGFVKKQPEPIVEIKGGRGITGTEFREKLVFAYRADTTRPFAAHFRDIRDLVSKELVLGELALRAGYREHADVVQRVDAEWEKGLLNRYLAETVAPKITFNRDEFSAFYAENKEQFRGPDEVRLDILILENLAEAEDASVRLRDGADFGRIFKEYNHGQELSSVRPKFIKVTELSQTIRGALTALKPGQSSEPLEMGMGYMVFRLDAQRPGAVPPLDAVEMDIRQALYQRKFNEILDENLELLRANSQIKRWPDRIEQYFLPAGGEK